MKISLIITAGGKGKRFSSKTPKQYFSIFGKPIIYWTIKRFSSFDVVDHFIIVLPKLEFAERSAELKKLFPNLQLKFVIGGNTRQESVLNGLLACKSDTDIVMIHDGVRPFVSDKNLNELIRTCEKTGSAIPGAKIVHTVKKIADGKIIQTIDRSRLINVFTPQVFDFKKLLSLHQQAQKENLDFTDESGLYEYFDLSTSFVECSSDNIKITKKEDVEIAKLLIKKYF